MQTFPGGEAEWRIEFVGAIEQLNVQTAQQRLDDLLQKKSESGLSEQENAELRERLAAKSAAHARDALS